MHEITQAPSVRSPSEQSMYGGPAGQVPLYHRLSRPTAASPFPMATVAELQKQGALPARPWRDAPTLQTNYIFDLTASAIPQRPHKHMCGMSNYRASLPIARILRATTRGIPAAICYQWRPPKEVTQCIVFPIQTPRPSIDDSAGSGQAIGLRNALGSVPTIEQ